MAFYIYVPTERGFLASDHRNWTHDLYDAATYGTRNEAESDAEGYLGEGHGAYILDDGQG